MAIAQVFSAFGAISVEQPVSSEQVEADIAVTDSIENAKRLLEETKQTIIVVAHLKEKDVLAANKFASLNPDRVHSIHYFGLCGQEQMSLVVLLLKIINDKSGVKINPNDLT